MRPSGAHRGTRIAGLAVRALSVPSFLRFALHSSDSGRPCRGARELTGRKDGPATIEALLAAKEIVVICGPGGVGKTTVAAAMAAMAACHQGGKVLVVTVDPARRLAKALGFRHGRGVERVRPSAFARAAGRSRGASSGPKCSTRNRAGTLWSAAMPPTQATAKRILDNPLYKDISGRFVQSHDYIAVERLYELHSEGKYDLIVVDTPPTRNAVDFLLAPERIADFFSSRLLRLLTVPYRSRFVDVASRPFYYVADRVLGSQFVQDLAEFFILFQTLSDGFVGQSPGGATFARGQAYHFHSRDHPRGSARPRSRGLYGLAPRKGFPSGGVVLNRVLPRYLLHADLAERAGRLSSKAGELARSLSSGPVAGADPALLNGC